MLCGCPFWSGRFLWGTFEKTLYGFAICGCLGFAEPLGSLRPLKTFTGKAYGARFAALVLPPSGGSTLAQVANGRRGTIASS